MENVYPSNELVSEYKQEVVALKKALEWELNLDSKDLKSHAWYHGNLPRQRAEEIVHYEGDFLIRDCASQPDNYVLTCRTKISVLHFVINKIVIQPETVYEHIQYLFEDDAFDAIPDLITFYVASGKAISKASGARIHRPCNRTYPLSFYGHKIMENQLHSQMLAGLHLIDKSIDFPLKIIKNVEQHQGTQQSELQCSFSYSIENTPPRLPSKKQRLQKFMPFQTRVTSTTNNKNYFENDCNVINSDNKNDLESINNKFEKIQDSNKDKKNMVDTILPMKFKLALKIDNFPHSNGCQTIARCNLSETVGHTTFTTHSLPRFSSNKTNHHNVSKLNSNLNIDGFGFNTNLYKKSHILKNTRSPPLKPHQFLNFSRKDMGPSINNANSSDSGNGSGELIQNVVTEDFCENTLHRGVIIKNPRFISYCVPSATLKKISEFNSNTAENKLSTLRLPKLKLVSKFDLENFNTVLLPLVDNHPLDSDALNILKSMLVETGSKIIAEHITRIDISLIIENPKNNIKTSLVNMCGLELLTSPHGKIFREDLIERTQCIKLIVAVTILTCHTDMDRADLLNKWIQIAIETKNALGNLFGFCAIMLGLCMPQIQQLDKTWHILRQKYTNSAFTFEAKLRPTLVSMNECSNPQAPNTTVPHVLLYALLKDRSVIDIINIDKKTEKSSLYTACITSWESKADDFGMSINFLHLDSSRNFLKCLSFYRKNSYIFLEESKSRLDDLLIDAFRTEFHIKFLWGSKGAISTPEDRHSKLENVLTIMANRFGFI